MPKPSEVHDGQIDHLFSRHMPVLQSGIPGGIEPQYDRTCPRHQAAADTVFKLRAPSRDVGRKRDRARPNPRICGNAAFIGEQAITPSSLCMNLSLMRVAVPRHAHLQSYASYQLLNECLAPTPPVLSA